FRLKEATAEKARASIRSLSALLKNSQEKRSLDGFIDARRKEKQITQELSEHLAKTFDTPLEREDIQALGNSLYKIPKSVEKFGERLMFSGEHIREVSFAK